MPRLNQPYFQQKKQILCKKNVCGHKNGKFIYVRAPRKGARPQKNLAARQNNWSGGGKIIDLKVFFIYNSLAL